ncbi:universal stress protein [Haliangium ochraceum]|uniref:UspA domain protein n=1 Tax=Haliangium ochraceum (strain DSM 14365 / JCM 11303 / SMP-2) TaxID=502025 RepID=D0LV05_HALO1|nr:universal stress protein [Haliangium ochraceum]ACY15846.1 UspA domain protein [Haliangium ochraceum DSM 14365]
MIKTILFASDFSNLTDRAQSYALDLARATGAKVTLIHSVEPIEGAGDDEYVAKLLEGRVQDARSKSQSVVAAFEEAEIACDVRVEVGKRWKAIVDAASSGDYDLVVLGSHKINDGDKVYLGTTTHKVFFATEVPLLVVPST